jgi:hypothetical protein
MSPIANQTSRQTVRTLTVPGRFEGPPGMGNGGYSCGTFARLVEGPAEVTLKRPVPLDRPLSSLEATDGTVEIRDEDALIAEVRSSGPLDGTEPPVRPTVEQATRYSEASPFRSDDHPFPGCFVCGHQHPDGLHIYVGKVDGRIDLSSGVLAPPASVPSTGGAIDPEIVWAALDCPSFTAHRLLTAGPHVLGRLSVELLAPVPSDRPSVVVGWETGSDGRKVHSASALLSPDGELLARSRALWIALAKG